MLHIISYFLASMCVKGSQLWSTLMLRGSRTDVVVIIYITTLSFETSIGSYIGQFVSRKAV